MNKSQHSLGVVVPAYQASAMLGETLQGILLQLPAICVVVVDDGSSDTTYSVAQSHSVHCIRFEHNQGKGAALYAGLTWLQEQGFLWGLTMDADGQHSPLDIPRFLDRLKTVPLNTAILAGSRDFTPGVMPMARIFSNTVSTWLVEMVAKSRVFDSQCGFRAYRLDLLQKGLLPSFGRFEWESKVLIHSAWAGLGIERVPVRTIYVSNGHSHISHWRDTRRFLAMLYTISRNRGHA